MQTVNGELTQPTSSEVAQLQERKKERWEVVVGKEVFTLDGEQIRIFKEADKHGMRGMIWFDNFAISIPHVQSVSYKQRVTTHHYDPKLDTMVEDN